MTPRRPPCPSERASQVALVQWADLVAVRLWPQFAVHTFEQRGVRVIVKGKEKTVKRWFPVILFPITHAANGGSRGMIEAVNFKRMGVRAGFPDLTVHVRTERYGALHIEMKTDKGEASPAQGAWVAHLNAHGDLAVVCHSFEEAKATVTAYMNSARGDGR